MICWLTSGRSMPLTGASAGRRVRRSSSTRLIISLVAIFLIGALTFMRGKIDSLFTTIGSAL